MMAKIQILLMLALFCGCVNYGGRHVSASEFIKFYNADRYPNKRWDYKGIIDGFHVLEHYTVEPRNGSVVRLVDTVWVAEEDVPDTFPEKDQSEIIKPHPIDVF